MAKVPAWAVFPAATQLIVQSFRHPNTDKAIYVDDATHHVSVVPVKNGDGEHVTAAEASTH